jgi:hypothetical protein
MTKKWTLKIYFIDKDGKEFKSEVQVNSLVQGGIVIKKYLEKHPEYLGARTITILNEYSKVG